MRSNRPLSRSVLKLLWRVLGGKRRAHFYEWFPFLCVELACDEKTGHVSYRGKAIATLYPISVLKQAAGDDIFIVGTGPSLREADLSGIPAASALLLNGAMTLIGSGIQTPLAVVVEDERFLWRHFAEIRDLVPHNGICVLSVEAIRAIADMDSAWLADKRIVLLTDIRKPYRQVMRGIEALQKLNWARLKGGDAVGFSTQPESGVFKAGSVVVSAFQLAVACAPKRIGFLGIDISNAANGQARFYEKKDEAAFSGVARAEDRIVSHLAFGREIALAGNISVTNHSAISALRKAGFGYDPRFEKNAGNAGVSSGD